MIAINFATFLALCASVRALAFDGPRPTPTIKLKHAKTNGWSPKPTNQVPSLPDLFRRANNGLCGYIQGLSDYPIYCTTGFCSSNTSLNWFGCCTGTDLGDCTIATRCIASTSLDACDADSSCYIDPYVTACTAASAPVCAQLVSVASQKTFTHVVCAATSTALSVLASVGQTVKVAATGKVTQSAGQQSSVSAGSASADSLKGTTAAQTAGLASAGLSIIASATPSKGGVAAIQTANAAVGVLGGLAGVFALLV